MERLVLPACVAALGATIAVLSSATQAPTIPPDPLRHLVSFVLAGSSSPVERLDIFDASGRRVRSIPAGPGSASPGRLEWNGSDESGRAVPPGLYMVRTRSGRSIRVVRVL